MRIMKIPTTAILDGDMIAHRAAYITEDIEEVPMVIRQIIRSWTPPKTKHVFVARSADRADNFRRSVWCDYKAHRDRKEVPEDQKERLEYAKDLIAEDDFHCKFVPTLEADDLMGIAASSGKAVAVTLDKDLLSTPGWHYRPEYSYKGKGGEKTTKTAELIYQPEWRADLMFYQQWLMGDMTDNYPGIKNMGPKKSYKLLSKWHPRNWDSVCMAAYEQAGYDWDYALAMAQVARILRHDEWTSDDGVRLWSPKWA
tara:strand:- start:578 stop:1342 length:765 start_codon:yes stop_codon:yes gene_type:complete